MSLIYFFYLTNFFYSSNFTVTQNRAKLKSNTKSWSAIRTRCPSQKNKKNKKHTKTLSRFRNNPPDATADSSTKSSWIRTVFFAEGLLTLPPIPPNPCFLRNSSSRYGGTPTFLHLQISRWEFSPNFETAPSRPVWRRERRQKKSEKQDNNQQTWVSHLIQQNIANHAKQSIWKGSAMMFGFQSGHTTFVATRTSGQREWLQQRPSTTILEP